MFSFTQTGMKQKQALICRCVIPQDLLSFELLDINIVQELENVPNNTPAGKNSSPCCCLGNI